MMKSHFILYPLVLLLTLLPFGACKKRPFDYRNNYQGVWRFTSTYYKWTAYRGEAKIKTEEFRGRVYYDGLQDEKNEVMIEFTEDITASVTLDKSGHFTGCGGRGQFKTKKSLEFIYLSNNCSTSYSSGVSYTVSGTKEYSE